MMQVLIDGEDRTGIVDLTSIDTKADSSARGTASFTLKDKDGTHMAELEAAMEVIIMDSKSMETIQAHGWVGDGVSGYGKLTLPKVPAIATVRVKFIRQDLSSGGIFSMGWRPSFVLNEGGTLNIDWGGMTDPGYPSGWANAQYPDSSSREIPCGIGEHELVMRYNTASLYYDVTLDGRLVDARQVAFMPPAADGTWLVIGGHDYGEVFSSAIIKRASVWDEWLSDGELARMLSGFQPCEGDPRLVVDLDFHEGSGILTQDLAQGLEMDFEGTYGWFPYSEDRPTRAFGGSISTCDDTIQLGTVARSGPVSCDDFNELADRQQNVTEHYADTNQGNIARDLVTKYLAQYGVTCNHVEDGPIIHDASFQFTSPSAAFDKLKEATGYVWRIDAYKDLWFCSRTSNAAPWGISDSSQPYVSFSMRRDRTKLANRIIMQGGKGASDKVYTDTITTNGNDKSWKLSYMPAGGVTATLGGTALKVGIKQVSSGCDLYWSTSDQTVEQDENATAWATGQALVVSYQRQITIFAIAQDDASIAERATAEGTSGVYELFVQDASVKTISECIDALLAQLRQRSQVQGKVTMETDRPGLMPGQVIPIQLSRMSIDTDMLIESVTGKVLDMVNDGSEEAEPYIRYTITALSGERIGSFAEFLKSLVSQGKDQITVGDEGTLMKVNNYAATVACQDVLAMASVPSITVGLNGVGAGGLL